MISLGSYRAYTNIDKRLVESKGAAKKQIISSGTTATLSITLIEFLQISNTGPA